MAQHFESDDEKISAALQFARDIVETRGHPSDRTFGAARDAGLTDEQLMEIIAHVVLNTYSNYMNEALETEVDIPEVEPVQSR